MFSGTFPPNTRTTQADIKSASLRSRCSVSTRCSFQSRGEKWEGVARWLKTLKLVNDWDYRSLCIEMAQRGYQKSEPNTAPRETSQVSQKVFAALREDGVTRADIAVQLAVHVNEIDELVFGLALTALVGDKQAQSRPRRPVLQLIEGGRG